MGTPSFIKTQTDGDIEKLVEFLTTSIIFIGDGQYFTASGLLPLSYYSTPDYWGDYVCDTWAKQNNQDCTVTIMDHGGGNEKYYRNGQGSHGAQLQMERVNASLGTDIYDSACWQIALALAATKGLAGVSESEIFSMIDVTTQRLKPTVKAVRANTPNFKYGYQDTIENPGEAYALRLLGSDFWARDPLWDTDYQDYISHWPPCSRTLLGSISWSDWKPITGENAWAFLIGALQADYLRFNKQGYIPFKADSVQNALYVLYAFQRMQCAIGAIYYAPGGSDGNTGAITPGEISVENNASCLSGFCIFMQLLKSTLEKDTALSSDDHTKIKAAINLISIMIWGGQSPGGHTDGLLKFFETKAWNKAEGVFYQGGTYTTVWTPTAKPYAVDVNTWGLTVLGPKTIDRWFGEGTTYSLWNIVKTWGSYSQNATLWGVGYSSEDNHTIMSAEWTAGAINALRCLIIYYQNDKTKHDSLIADHDAMMTNIVNLRTDKYIGAGFQGGLEEHFFTYVKPPAGQLAFLYASKRYYIPFGWYANPIPSTTSTSWMIYLHYDYNPFQLGGSYESYDWVIPSYDAANFEGPWNVKGDVINLTVRNDVDGADIMPSYKPDSSSGYQNLLKTPIPVGGSAVIELPAKACGFMVTYNKPKDMAADNWPRACLLDQSQIVEIKSGQTIIAIWTGDEGDGDCQIGNQ